MQTDDDVPLNKRQPDHVPAGVHTKARHQMTAGATSYPMHGPQKVQKIVLAQTMSSLLNNVQACLHTTGANVYIGL